MKKIAKILDHAHKWRDLFLDTVFPVECVICQEEGSYLCGACQNNIYKNKFQTCPACGKEKEFGRYCSRCGTKDLKGILAVSSFKKKNTENAIKKYKYNFIKDLSLPLAIILTDHFNDAALKDGKIFGSYRSRDILVMPVPLHKKRLNWRGFNQSEELAFEFARRRGLSINTKHLIKTKNTRPQVKLKSEDRLSNLEDCFSWKGRNIENKCVVLVDDICTTGATLKECAKTLKSSGVKNIWGLVLAKG